MSIVDRIRREIKVGDTIPKPAAKEDFKVKGWGRSRGKAALVYYIPSHTNPCKPSTKRVTDADFEAAYDRLVATGEFTRQWFEDKLPVCAGDGDCNFTTIGGIFILLELAEFAGNGVYRCKNGVQA